MPVTPFTFQTHTTVAILVGMDTATLSRKLVLDQGDTKSYAGIISRQGAFIMRGSEGAACRGA